MTSGTEFAQRHPDAAARVIVVSHRLGGDVSNAWDVLVSAFDPLVGSWLLRAVAAEMGADADAIAEEHQLPNYQQSSRMDPYAQAAGVELLPLVTATAAAVAAARESIVDPRIEEMHKRLQRALLLAGRLADGHDPEFEAALRSFRRRHPIEGG